MYTTNGMKKGGGGSSEETGNVEGVETQNGAQVARVLEAAPTGAGASQGHPDLYWQPRRGRYQNV